MINETNLKTILITGSHGYIGSVVYPELEKFGYTIKGIDNGYFLDCLVSGSIRDLQFTKKHLDRVGVADLEGIDAVIHLSGLQNDPLKSTLPGRVYDIEYSYTKKLAMAIKGKKNRYFLNVTFSADFAKLQKKVSGNHDLGA